MTEERRILFRVDAGRSAGWGHLMRCLTLAEALRRRGWSCLFCTYGDDGLAQRLADQRRFATVPLALNGVDQVGQDEDLRQVLRGGAEKGIRALVVDSYLIPDDYLERLKERGWFVICLDDHAERRLKVDLVINGNLGAEQLPYRCPAHTRLLLGAQYALLRSEFRRVRESQGLAPLRPAVERILVCFGGSDWRGQTVRVLRLLRRLPETFSVQVLVTSSFAQRASLRSLLRRSNRQSEILCEPANVGRLMRACDLAITAAGVTSYELACLGVPFLVMKLYENQRFVYQRLVQERIALSAGEWGVDCGGFFLRQLRRLLLSRRLRAELQQQAARTIDGLGAERVADALCAQWEAHLRPAASAAHKDLHAVSLSGAE